MNPSFSDICKEIYLNLTHEVKFNIINNDVEFTTNRSEGDIGFENEIKYFKKVKPFLDNELFKHLVVSACDGVKSGTLDWSWKKYPCLFITNDNGFHKEIWSA
jgi:hypothetical protein